MPLLLCYILPTQIVQALALFDNGFSLEMKSQHYIQKSTQKSWTVRKVLKIVRICGFTRLKQLKIELDRGLIDTYNHQIMQEDNINTFYFVEDFDLEGMLEFGIHERLESSIIELEAPHDVNSEFNDDLFENRHRGFASYSEGYISQSEDILRDIEKVGSVQTDTQIQSPQPLSRGIVSELTVKGLVCKGIKKDKNSNAIKKIGRIILDNLKKYDLKQKPNLSLNSMLRVLSKHAKIGRYQINKRDKFNTHHFKLLLNDADPQVVHHNLKVTQYILNKNLRNNVLHSAQITDANKIVYLNTLKCTSLRCGNNKLAVRLQMHS